MNRYKQIPQFAMSLGVGVSAVFAAWTAKWLKQFSLPDWFVLLTILLTTGFGGWFITTAFRYLFESSKWVRRRLLGRQFVEGTWFIEIRLNNELTGFAVSRIEADGTSLRWSGEHYDLEGQILGSVKGKVIEIDWPKIRYSYESDRDDPNNLHREGYGERTFMEQDGPPVGFNGQFIDHLSGEKKRTRAWKVKNKEESAELRNPQKCEAFIERYKVQLLQKLRNSSDKLLE